MGIRKRERTMRDEVKAFCEFCREKVSLLGITICAFLSYGLLGRGAIGIDDEAIDEYVNGGALIAQDRVGWSITNKIFPGYSFLPLWTITIGVILVIVGLLLWLFGLEKKNNINVSKKFTTITIGILISFPYIAKFAIFCGNMTAMGYVLIFTSIALYASYYIWEKIRIKYMFILVFSLCMVLLFEKTYIVLFVQGMVLFALIKCCDETKRIHILQLTKWFSIIGVGGIISFSITQLIIKIIHVCTEIEPNGYTGSYIKYNTTSINDLIVSIRNFVPDYFSAEHQKITIYFGEKIYIVALCVMCVLMIYSSIKKRDIKIIFLSIIAIILSQSVLIVTGNIYMPIRSYCFNYVFFIGTAIILGKYILKNKAVILYYIVGLWLIALQTKEMEDVYYKKIITFEKDRNYAENILNTIEKECGTVAAYNKQIVFMGFDNNCTITYGEPEETSMFVWGRNENTDLEESSNRVFNFYDELGYSLLRPDREMIDYYEVRKLVSSMPSYPSDGCVRETDDYIVIKLGDSLCEIVDDSEMSWENNLDLSASIEWFDYDNRILQLGGWIVEEGENSYNNNISLVLKNDEDAYRIRVDEIDRRDVTEYIADGCNYDNCGFQIMVNLPKYVKNNDYQVYLEVVNNKGKYLYNVQHNVLVDE